MGRFGSDTLTFFYDRMTSHQSFIVYLVKVRILKYETGPSRSKQTKKAKGINPSLPY